MRLLRGMWDHETLPCRWSALMFRELRQSRRRDLQIFVGLRLGTVEIEGLPCDSDSLNFRRDGKSRCS